MHIAPFKFSWSSRSRKLTNSCSFYYSTNQENGMPFLSVATATNWWDCNLMTLQCHSCDDHNDVMDDTRSQNEYGPAEQYFYILFYYCVYIILIFGLLCIWIEQRQSCKPFFETACAIGSLAQNAGSLRGSDVELILIALLKEYLWKKGVLARPTRRRRTMPPTGVPLAPFPDPHMKPGLLVCCWTEAFPWHHYY